MMRWDGWMRSGLKSGLIAFGFVILGNLPVLAQEKPVVENAAAATALANPKTTYQQKNYQGAAEQIRNFIKTYEKRAEVPLGRYGPALALAATPQPDCHAIFELLA